jgi:hypothetical protein
MKGSQQVARGARPRPVLFCARSVPLRRRPGPDIVNPNLLTALEQWVEHASAPERIIATKSNSPLARPICPYPELARYVGSGDTNDPANFVCVKAIDREPFRKNDHQR